MLGRKRIEYSSRSSMIIESLNRFGKTILLYVIALESQRVISFKSAR